MLPPQAPPKNEPHSDSIPIAVDGVAIVLFLLLHLPFLGQAFHIDDANFLILAKGVAAHPLTPQDISINWLGTQERAFDVLSNPPGVAWLLALADATHLAPYAHHLVILPFTALFSWAAISLSKQLLRGSIWPGLFLMASPALVVSAHTVMPDIPLIALLFSGLAFAIQGIEKKQTQFLYLGALLGGLASLFRYNGALFIPILILYLFFGTRRRPAAKTLALSLLIAAMPSLLFAAHGAYFYGIPHVLQMVSFQQGESGDFKALNQLLAQVSFLGGCALFPLLPAFRRGLSQLFFTLGAGVGIYLGWQDGLVTTVLLSLFMGAGFALISPIFTADGRRDKVGTFLVLWLLLGLLFNQMLRFTSVRYLLPLLPPVLFLWGRGLPKKPSRWIWAGLMGTVILSLSIATGDYLQAGAYRDGVLALNWQENPEQTRYFSGHWGMQHYLEAQGALALSEDGAIPPTGAYIITAHLPWPQEVPIGTHSQKIRSQALSIPWPIHTLRASPPACFYANALATGDLTQPAMGTEGRTSFLPYTWASGPFDSIDVYTVTGGN